MGRLMCFRVFFLFCGETDHCLLWDSFPLCWEPDSPLPSLSRRTLAVVRSRFHSSVGFSRLCFPSQSMNPEMSVPMGGKSSLIQKSTPLPLQCSLGRLGSTIVIFLPFIDSSVKYLTFSECFREPQIWKTAVSVLSASSKQMNIRLPRSVLSSTDKTSPSTDRDRWEEG